MKAPSLQRTAVFSAVLHLTFFLTAVLVLKESRKVVLPSPYIVNLVQNIRPGNAADKGETAKPEHKEAKTAPAEKSAPKKETISKAEEERVEDVIASLEAKAVLKRSNKLKMAMHSIDVNAVPDKAPSSQRTGGRSRGLPGGGTYEDRIGSEIHRYWNLPENMKMKLETVVSVRILKDGTISVQAIEASSGNRYFDKSVLKTIAMASPVSPPPHEMDVLLRFNNENAKGVHN